MTDTRSATTDQRRADFTAGLRAIADMLDANPILPLPYEGNSSPLTWFIHDDLNQALVLRDLMSIDTTTSRDPASAVFPVDIRGHLHGLMVTVHVAAKVALLDATIPPVWPACDPRLGLDVVPADVAS